MSTKAVRKNIAEPTGPIQNTYFRGTVIMVKESSSSRTTPRKVRVTKKSSTAAKSSVSDFPINRWALCRRVGIRGSKRSTSIWLPLSSAGASARKNTKTSMKIVRSSSAATGQLKA